MHVATLPTSNVIVFKLLYVAEIWVPIQNLARVFLQITTTTCV